MLIQRLNTEINQHDRAVHVSVSVLCFAHNLPTKVDHLELEVVLFRWTSQQGQSKLFYQQQLIIYFVCKVGFDTALNHCYCNRDDLRWEVPDNGLEKDCVFLVVAVKSPHIFKYITVGLVG